MSVLDGGGSAEYYASADRGGAGGGHDGGDAGGDAGRSGEPPAAADAPRTPAARGAPPARAPAFGAAELAAVLEVLARESVRERQPDDADLERLIGEALAGLSGAPPGRAAQSGDATPGAPPGTATPLVDTLRSAGYLTEPDARGAGRRLTRRGFAAVGNRILREVMREMSPIGLGPHETRAGGIGSSTLSDQTRRIEQGEPADASRIDAVRTILNAAERAGAGGAGDPFPLRIEPEDVEEVEAARDAGAAVVYCIDLSSTMKYRLGGPAGPSRIEAAKRALWSLYMLTQRHFPADSVFVVGFASLAARVDPMDIPRLRTFEAGDENLHYTNYQAALRLASRILDREAGDRNRRIVLITDGQPSACLVDTGRQRGRIMSAKPYANLYVPSREAAGRIARERGMRWGLHGAAPAAAPAAAGGPLHAGGQLVYLCYRHKRIDPVIDECTVLEAGRCARRGARIDTIVVSDEAELISYADSLERRLGGSAYHVSGPGMGSVLIRDYLRGARRP